jgi:hypothetical protein
MGISQSARVHILNDNVFRSVPTLQRGTAGLFI